MTNKSISQTVAAIRLGISTSWLRTLTNRGTITRNSDGRYLWPNCRDEYLAYKAALDTGDKSDAEAQYEDARARREQARARMAEMEVRQREGELVEQEVVDRVYGDMLTAVRATLGNAPGRWASSFGECPPREAETVLKRMSAELLEHLSAPVAEAVEAGDDAPEPEVEAR